MGAKKLAKRSKVKPFIKVSRSATRLARLATKAWGGVVLRKERMGSAECVLDEFGSMARERQSFGLERTTAKLLRIGTGARFPSVLVCAVDVPRNVSQPSAVEACGFDGSDERSAYLRQ